RLALFGMQLLLTGIIAVPTLLWPETATATPTGTGNSNNMTGATFLFIQGAQSGSVSEVNATTSTLELNNVSDKTILFSDRPDRIVASIDTADFIGTWRSGAHRF